MSAAASECDRANPATAPSIAIAEGHNCLIFGGVVCQESGKLVVQVAVA